MDIKELQKLYDKLDYPFGSKSGPRDMIRIIVEHFNISEELAKQGGGVRVTEILTALRELAYNETYKRLPED